MLSDMSGYAAKSGKRDLGPNLEGFGTFLSSSEQRFAPKMEDG